VVQVQEHFAQKAWQQIPELEAIVSLFERAKTGIAFYGETKKIVGLRLKALQQLDKFSQYLELMQLFQLMATSAEFELLQVRPISNQQLLNQQNRMHQIYYFVETHFKQRINVAQVAQAVHLSVPAFCRYFKKTTQLTYTDFVNQYRITIAKKLLLQNKTISEAGFEAGFDNLSYFTRTFKKVTGLTPTQYKQTNTSP
jgi:AraC-like DNA-binding protein